MTDLRMKKAKLMKVGADISMTLQYICGLGRTEWRVHQYLVLHFGNA